MERKVMRYVVDKFVIDGVYLFLLFVCFFKFIVGEFNIFICGIGRYLYRINSWIGESEIYFYKFLRYFSFVGDVLFMDFKMDEGG